MMYNTYIQDQNQQSISSLFCTDEKKSEPVVPVRMISISFSNWCDCVLLDSPKTVSEKPVKSLGRWYDGDLKDSSGRS